MISGTALQERAYAIASKDETIRALFMNLSLENSLEGRAKISITKKTVTNAEVITLNRLCSGNVVTVASLIMKVDPAEGIFDPHLLTNPYDYSIHTY